METIKIVDFNPVFLDIFEKYKKIIHEILSDLHIELFGSAAVPMNGKEEIDILIIADNYKEIQEILSQNGFGKGPIEGTIAYLRDYRFGIEAEFHIMHSKTKKIEQARALVEILKKNPKLRKKFEDFKRSCDGMSREDYRKRKTEFIKKIFEK